MDRERQDAVKAAANITRGINGKPKAVKREDERSPRGTPSFKNNQGRMGTVHTPPFVPREALDVSLDQGGQMVGYCLHHLISMKRSGFVTIAKPPTEDRYAPVQFVI